MLKIRDDVYLKELEKFGFEHFENGCATTGYSKDTGYRYYTIIEKDKELYNKNNIERLLPPGMDQNLLYDLIQAGLVEKVEG